MKVQTQLSCFDWFT